MVHFSLSAAYRSQDFESNDIKITVLSVFYSVKIIYFVRVVKQVKQVLSIYTCTIYFYSTSFEVKRNIL